MLRALTSYFFGGIEDESPEAPIECETREVNDWLVVNLPDQNKDSINLNDDDEDTYEIDDDDARDVMDEDEPVEVDAFDDNEMDLEDDILMSLSFLMTPPEIEKDSNDISHQLSLFTSRFLQGLEIQECLLFPPIFQDGPLDSDNETTDNKCLPVYQRPLTVHMLENYKNSNKRNMGEAILNLIMPERRLRAKREAIVNEYERKQKVAAHILDLTPPPMYSKNYVNHRHPGKLLNNDLLQRIKELEPEQQAVQRSVKKTLTRGQLNRQNKNYMYETSSKKNRRSNRQRNPSGANNNRKC